MTTTTQHTPIRRTRISVAPLTEASGPTMHRPFAALVCALLAGVTLVLAFVLAHAIEAARALVWVLAALAVVALVWIAVVWCVLLSWLWVWAAAFAAAMGR